MAKTKTRFTTADRGPPGVRVHTTEQLGPNSSVLPNGNLLYRNVPVARVGWMQYGEGEVPIEVNDHGIAYVERTEDELFTDQVLGGFIGAAITDDHPDEDVTPDNWKQLSGGIVLTAQRGEGEFKDCIVCDLLITDRKLIKAIKQGKREVSAGYDAKYQQLDVGLGRQTDIIVNHLALVDKGRCGPRCAIGDRAYRKENSMATTNRVKLSAKDRVRVIFRDAEAKALQALRTGDAEGEDPTEDELADTTEGGGSSGTHIHIHTGSGGGANKATTATDEEEGGKKDEEDDPVEKRFKGIEDSMKTIGDAVAQLAESLKPKADTSDEKLDEEEEEKAKDTKDEKEDEEDDKSKTGDSAPLQTSFSDVASKAEILVPGFRMPTFDAKLPRKKTVDAMCGARRRALDMALGTTDGQNLVNSVAGKKFTTTDGLDCKEVAILFNAASGARALLNNASATARVVDTASKDQGKPVVQNLASLNKLNQDYWANQQANAAARVK